eukprot:7562498-Ditylum_brightwellii.AAC.1
MTINSCKASTIGQKAILTRSKLKKKVDWGEWLASKKTQLDNMEDLEMYGEPTYAPKGAKSMCSICTYMIKHDGRKKAGNCCSGSVLKGKGVDYAHTYSSCASQVGMKLFTAIAAWNNYFIIGADATNSFAQSPPPTEPTYMRIGDHYADWYKNKYGKDLDYSKVLPDLHALQEGRPESGALWGKH